MRIELGYNTSKNTIYKKLGVDMGSYVEVDSINEEKAKKVIKALDEEIKIKIRAKEDIRAQHIKIFGETIVYQKHKKSDPYLPNAGFISGKIYGGGSVNYPRAYIEKGTELTIEVSKVLYNKNKNRVQNWEIEEYKETEISDQEIDELIN